MKFLRKLDHNLITSLAVYFVSILGFGVSSFLLSTEYIDIPLGFLFSGGVIGTLYILTYLFVKLDERQGKNLFGIISIGFRFLIVIGVMIIIAFMNYRWNNKLFNLFVFVGIYSLGTLIYVLLHLLNKERKEKDA